jgi:hypothetical protein
MECSKVTDSSTLVAKIWTIERNIIRVRDKFESVTPQGMKVSEVVFQIFSLLSTARMTLLNGSHEEAGNYVAIVEGLLAPVMAVLDPQKRWEFY